jgi:hypothetical protein
LPAKLAIIFNDRGLLRGQRNGSILDRSRYFSFKQLLKYPHEAEGIPFQAHYFSENLVAPRIELGTSGYVARNSDHKAIEAVDSLKFKITIFIEPAFL